ncbi:MAG: thioredoxin domain-containing protein [Chlamydiia bacterium]|nr:thioredoxin domain-containing protein [Chlamydiia bacterium]
MSTLQGTHMRSWSFYLNLFIGLCLCAGLTLSILSLMEICTTACAEGHKYRLYGFKFEPLGIAFFLGLLGIYAAQFYSEKFRYLLSIALFGGLGAEIKFILVQKYVIKQWCPVCLSIAAAMFLATIGSIALLPNWTQYSEERKSPMKEYLRILVVLAVIGAGFTVASAGLSKYELTLEEQVGKDMPFIGNLNSSVTVYFFTDWFCPACAKVEPKIESDFNQISRLARIGFIDVPVHDESYNYIPYNLALLFNSKNQYISLRKKLHDLAETSKSPSQSQVESLVASSGGHFVPLNYSDVNLGIKYFRKVAKKFDVTTTPTVVIINNSTKKAIKLTSSQEILNANFPQLIRSLEK